MLVFGLFILFLGSYVSYLDMVERNKGDDE